MRSSYIKNNFGEVIREYILGWRPVSLVELGVLDGYSTMWIAEGLKIAGPLYGINSKLDAYDLFDDYQYKHGNKEEVQQMLNEKGLAEYVNLLQGDAYKVWDRYADKSIEFLHIDISNTGEVVRKIIELWHPKIHDKGLVLIEGGSSERDQVDWMIEHNMPSIKKEIETNDTINAYYIYGTYFRFPSLTVMVRKWWC